MASMIPATDGRVSRRWTRPMRRCAAAAPMRGCISRSAFASMSPEVPLITAVGAAAADCLARAVLVGVLAAEELAGIPTYRGLLPGAFE